MIGCVLARSRRSQYCWELGKTQTALLRAGRLLERGTPLKRRSRSKMVHLDAASVTFAIRKIKRVSRSSTAVRARARARVSIKKEEGKSRGEDRNKMLRHKRGKHNYVRLFKEARNKREEFGTRDETRRDRSFGKESEKVSLEKRSETVERKETRSFVGGYLPKVLNHIWKRYQVNGSFPTFSADRASH